MSTKRRIGVVRGSESARVLSHLRAMPSVLELRDIFVDHNGTWLVDGRELPPERALRSVDVVVNALHGGFGEGGHAARVLETVGVPYTGSRPLASAITLQTHYARGQAAAMHICTPESAVIRAVDNIHEQANDLVRHLSFPLLVSPMVGSMVRPRRVDHFESLLGTIHEATARSSNILVEKLYDGRHAVVGIIDGFRGEKLYALPPVELEHDYVFGEEPRAIYPTRFPSALKRELAELARQLHTALDVRHYGQYEFLVTQDGKIMFLHARTLPPLYEAAVFPQALHAVGANLEQFLEHIVERAVTLS